MDVPASLLADPLAPGDRALLDRLSALSRSEDRATHGMPGAFYTSIRFVELERQRVFRRTWVCIGHVGEIPKAGDYFTTEMVGEPLQKGLGSTFYSPGPLSAENLEGTLRDFYSFMAHRICD